MNYEHPTHQPHLLEYVKITPTGPVNTVLDSERRPKPPHRRLFQDVWRLKQTPWVSWIGLPWRPSKNTFRKPRETPEATKGTNQKNKNHEINLRTKHQENTGEDPHRANKNKQNDHGTRPFVGHPASSPKDPETLRVQRGLPFLRGWWGVSGIRNGDWGHQKHGRWPSISSMIFNDCLFLSCFKNKTSMNIRHSFRPSLAQNSWKASRCLSWSGYRLLQTNIQKIAQQKSLQNPNSLGRGKPLGYQQPPRGLPASSLFSSWKLPLPESLVLKSSMASPACSRRVRRKAGSLLRR